ncbi:hypothetical protein EV673_2115 [Limnobacter thiooxidans]|uniref:Uncharacterized protein n=1 Tax=Limnobacter thiooxidans TaxID=131080 RepID=A0AA86JHH4_9BURK|nr:hypothetical protein [Limnobacter sp.]MCZ8015006.1 hypothetical protein [Limnobacter sp.]RZS40351.1 hypothetical protein EV673_2115 [Limnobacter thiooxidans]BET27216.1 hypothetical protein RGQ30_27170 [Limnobacter thiooxidans]
MALKSTDMAKNMAKKLDGSLKSESLPDRFGQSSKAAASKRERAADIPASKLISVNYRLPAELVNRLRDHALHCEGGINQLVASALNEWLMSQDKK